MSGKFILTITAGAKAGEVFEFDEHDTLLFGRMDDAHVCLPHDKQVSRHHFLLEVNPPNARIRDLGSRNGTYINGRKYGGREKHETPEEGARRRYPEVDLYDGDEIKVGQTILCGRVEVAENAPEPIHCQRCGKDASVEVGPGQHGDFVCKSCRQQIDADPGAQLLALLQQAQPQGHARLQIPDYQIQRKLGAGGMGAVYLVRHTKQGHLAALKVMLSKVAVNEHARKEFLREMEITRTLRHKYIVDFLDSGAQGSAFYFLLEYCAGGSASDLMKRRAGRLALEEAGPIMLQALEGLAFAHDRGFVHRDLKPQNILLTGQGQDWTAKIADLGLAKSFTQAGFSGMTVTGGYAGSFPFMPREQVINFKYVKPVSDVWSMGATCYNILTGHYPRTQHPGQDPMEVILGGEIVPIHQRAPQLPQAVAEVIDRALTNNANERYQDAGEMYEGLAKALREAKERNGV